ncbi:PREDICTED: beta-glucuronidase-like isoform X2 [Nicrophorus vespilloides]|nr:PREDICTED: beta-glucuronidase-like isoform X2 [Nicrophorus vespilloides]XP_017773136.1 PREDICTED: beta-glucuronidase-like isoform X2 [Nicrophorus vespilloides]XP_017773137.1 PREDICTED: beta-glucuronidase-like isoform X2 [Nicrophorus vespilloides]
MKLTTSLLLVLCANEIHGLLYPKTSESREIISLDGIWNFLVDTTSIGDLVWFKPKMDKRNDATLMPVPSSYNDVSTELNVREHVGAVWYERSFFTPNSWKENRVWLRFSSVQYSSQVWINDRFVGANEMGHLPFQFDVTNYLKFGRENNVTVSCDNTLLPFTIPQGNISLVETDDGVKLQQTYTFDFFNYAGIHRSVLLYTTPKIYIEDVHIKTLSLTEGSAIVQFNVSTIGSRNVEVHLHDQDEKLIVKTLGCLGNVTVPRANLWWPYLMHQNPGYQYTFTFLLLDYDGRVSDVYREKFGIRVLEWNEDEFKINGKRIYLHGFGKHEDSDIRGRGFDLVTTMRDFNLIKWIGGNAFRTSHYPYSEEIMDLADRLGIMVIDECPAVNIDFVSPKLLENHKDSIERLMNRDKNRPSVIAWSIANEPRSHKKNTGQYFKNVVDFAKSLDQSRPVTASLNRGYFEDQLAQYLDIISFNRYNSWYQNEGKLDMIVKRVVEEATNWRKKFMKPVLMSEYGADTLEGLHFLPDFIWSEEYQIAVLSNHFKAFDSLRNSSWFLGEFVWNFADFKTSQKINRVGGNKKGLFTRNRQPKASAFHLRRRYHRLSNELYNSPLPGDLDDYVCSNER